MSGGIRSRSDEGPRDPMTMRAEIPPGAFRLAPPLGLLLLWSLLSAFSSSARAHDPYEAFATVTLHADRLELEITMAVSTALKLIDPEGKLPPLRPENLAQHRPRLTREAELLFILTSERKPLKALHTDIELTPENDLIFTVKYPPPAAGRLLFSAAFLRRLGEGYGGIIEVNDRHGQNLGWEQLRWAQPNFDLTLPPDAPAK